MSTDVTENSDLLVDRLVRFFSQQDSTSVKKIAHPDPHVEQMSQLSNDFFRKASVLIAVVKPSKRLESQIVLTVRSADLSSHAGQVSLPGGTREEQDISDVDTALRESEEEIGLAADAVEILGQLGEILLPSGFKVTPVIGLVHTEPRLIPCPIEVNEIFMAPTRLLLNSASYSESMMEYGGEPRRILELNYEGHRIWGATAVILHHLALQIE